MFDVWDGFFIRRTLMDRSRPFTLHMGLGMPTIKLVPVATPQIIERDGGRARIAIKHRRRLPQSTLPMIMLMAMAAFGHVCCRFTVIVASRSDKSECFHKHTRDLGGLFKSSGPDLHFWADDYTPL